MIQLVRPEKRKRRMHYVHLRYEYCVVDETVAWQIVHRDTWIMSGQQESNKRGKERRIITALP